MALSSPALCQAGSAACGLQPWGQSWAELGGGFGFGEAQFLGPNEAPRLPVQGPFLWGALNTRPRFLNATL